MAAEIFHAGRHSILVAGIGGDCHFVGLSLIRSALEGDGYNVACLGVQASLDEIFCYAPGFNLVMLSSVDGHAHYYLADFAERRRSLGETAPLFFVGGNLTVGGVPGAERRFLELGIDRVFVKFSDLRSVRELVRSELSLCDARFEGYLRWVSDAAVRRRSAKPESARPYRRASADLLVERKEVLESWHTGRGAESFEANAEALKRAESLARVQRRADAGGRTLLHPRSGVADLNEQRRLFDTFSSSGASVLSFQIDSLTRLNRYAEADAAIRDSRAAGRSTLNGFPLVSHGAAKVRELVLASKVPLQTRHSTRDPRLLSELSFAAGISAFEGGALCYNLPYYKDYAPAESLDRWGYVDTLSALYTEEFGIAVDREFFGTLTATLIPPTIAITIDIIEMLLAASCGVRSCSLGYAEQGNRSQDIAAIRVLRRLAYRYLSACGYAERVAISTVFHQYMAGFPNDRSRACELILESAITGRLSGATRIMTKTPAESFGVPSVADNLQGLALSATGMETAHPSLIDENAVAFEESLIETEAESMIASIIAEDPADLKNAIVRACRKGLIDIPFSPSVHVAGRVVCCRDLSGAVRFGNPGALALPSAIVRLHRELVGERFRSTIARGDISTLVEEDVLRVPRGEYETWPLDARGEWAKRFSIPATDPLGGAAALLP